MAEFYLISMRDLNIYLMADGDKFVWTKLKNDAIWFDDFEVAKQFANKYFKEFKDWVIDEVHDYEIDFNK